MKRRDFITLLGGGAVALPLAARGQEPGRIYRLGCLFAGPRDAPHYVALFDELRRLGFTEGQNLIIDAVGFGLSPERMEKHAADLVKARVDIILAGGDPAVRAAQGATASIPILAFTDDMLGQGFVTSLAKPGGNTTGVTILASELDGKRQEILIEAVPGVRRIAVLADSNVSTPSRLRALEDAARAQGERNHSRSGTRRRFEGSSVSVPTRCPHTKGRRNTRRWWRVQIGRTSIATRSRSCRLMFSDRIVYLTLATKDL